MIVGLVSGLYYRQKKGHDLIEVASRIEGGTSNIYYGNGFNLVEAPLVRVGDLPEVLSYICLL